MKRTASSTALAALIAIFAGPVLAKESSKRTQAKKPTCERAAYPGDPVCDIDEGKNSLPTPASRRIRRHDDGSGFIVRDGVSVDGKTNFNENRFGSAPLDKFSPRPRGRQVNGGTQLDFKF